MGAKTGIEWTDSSWNPIRGCSRVSEGCRHCYAERVARRFSGPGMPYEGLAVLSHGRPSWTGKVSFVKEHLLDPVRWKKPRRIFVNSMSDLFHERVTDEWIDRIFAVMALSPQHVFQVLTKRPQRMLSYLMIGNDRKLRVLSQMEAIAGGRIAHVEDTLPNVWLGVSVENQKAADERIPLLLQTPAAVRFISAEPLLGPVNLQQVQHDRTVEIDALTGDHGVLRPLAGRSNRKLDWIICGGESGPHARNMHPDWARGLRDQCAAAGVPFFMKQMGSIYGPRKGHDLPDDLDIKEFPKGKMDA